MADDSLAVRVHLEQRLRQEGYVVSLASDGIEAVETIRENPPDLAILDINMPRLDGYGVCQEILELKLTFPIVFLTSIRAGLPTPTCQPYSSRSHGGVAHGLRPPPTQLKPA